MVYLKVIYFRKAENGTNTVLVIPGGVDALGLWQGAEGGGFYDQFVR